jgi:3-phenylpropionate/cinnamic acid dioxygenase small subunit
MISESDRAQLARLPILFARCVDHRDMEVFATLFCVDAELIMPGGADLTEQLVLQGRERIVAHWQDRPPRLTRHLVANIDIIRCEPDTAELRSIGVAFRDPGSALPSNLADYHDQAVKEKDGQWRLRRRVISLAFPSS